MASKLLSGKAPEIVEAIKFEPGPVQPGLQPINVNGDKRYRVDPESDNFFKRVIELRQSIKEQLKFAPEAEKAELDTAQYSLKIAANATSYGIYMEVNVAKRNDRFSATVLSSTSEPFSFKTDKAEEPGPFFHPLLATLITGAARLMLATAERMVMDNGLEWSFCDTDSIAIARPEKMDPAEFVERVKQIVEWFGALNPYEFGGSILKVEDQNYSLDDPDKLESLYCWAVSAKRYALFNLTAENGPIMRKVSAHGLGHLQAPYDGDDVPAEIPEPHKSVLGRETKRWHSDFWFKIVSAALAGHPDQVDRGYHKALTGPAVSRYGATTPELLRWFRSYNANRAYRRQVKPFGFLLSLQALHSIEEEIVAPGSRGRRKAAKQIKPISVYVRDLADLKPFDRVTGRAVRRSLLKPYADALLDYHIYPESKFLNGNYIERGTTQRRHIEVTTVKHIGKEANDWERQAILGFELESMPAYGFGGVDPVDLADEIRPMIERWKIAGSARAFRVSASTLRKIIDDPFSASEPTRQQLAGRMPIAKQLFERASAEKRSKLNSLRAAVQQDGLRATARRLGTDASNLRRKLKLG